MVLAPQGIEDIYHSNISLLKRKNIVKTRKKETTLHEIKKLKKIIFFVFDFFLFCSIFLSFFKFFLGLVFLFILC